MAKTDLGDKQTCPNCGARFYDLRRRPAACPKCSTTFDPAEESVRVRRGRSRVAAHDPAYDEDEEEVAKKPAGDEDDEGEETEETPEVDAEADAEPIVTDDDEEGAASGDELPEGFSEEEADLEGETADDDSVPMLEDEEEFPADDIGELPAEDDDDSNR